MSPAREKIQMKKIARLTATAAIVALVVVLAACGTSHPTKATASKAPVVSTSAPAQAAPAAVPAASTADGTLVSDGYTPAYDLSTAQIAAYGPLAATDITSAARRPVAAASALPPRLSSSSARQAPASPQAGPAP